MTAEIRARCDVLTSLPGLASFNLWSGVPPPTGWNATAWMLLIDEERQAQSVDALRRSPRPCAVQCARCLEPWVGRDPAALRGEPLAGYILGELDPVLRQGSYTLRALGPQAPDPSG